jgi:hypothetical protein
MTAPAVEAATRGPLLTCQDELVDILETAGVRVLDTVSGRFLAPCAIIEPGDPFVGPANLGGSYRRVRWRVVLVVGATASGATLQRMAGLTERVVLAIGAAPGWTTPTVSGPRLVRVVGVEGGYTAAELIAETIAEL